jgi:hypothetical protein
MKAMKRVVLALVLGALVALVLGVGAAVAKFSYFSVELDPAAPVAGEPVTVIVRLWEDEAHTQPATWWPPEEPVDDLLEFRGSGGRVPVTLTRAGVAEYRAEVTLAEGDWTLYPFPLGRGALDAPPPGYPSPLTVTVASSAADLAPPGAVAAALLALAILATVAARRPIRWPATARRSRALRAPQTSTGTAPGSLGRPPARTAR